MHAYVSVHDLRVAVTPLVSAAPGPDADEAALTPAQLTATAAQGRLTRALHTLLSALQPQQQQQQQQQPDAASQSHCQQQQEQGRRRQRSVSVVHPGEVVSCLSWYVPEGVLEPGQQQDAAEALGVSVTLSELLE